MNLYWIRREKIVKALQDAEQCPRLVILVRGLIKVIMSQEWLFPQERIVACIGGGGGDLKK